MAPDRTQSRVRRRIGGSVARNSLDSVEFGYYSCGEAAGMSEASGSPTSTFRAGTQPAAPHAPGARAASIRLSNRVCVELPNSETYYLPRSEAVLLVQSGGASVLDAQHNGKLRRIRIAPTLKLRGLSCRIGETLCHMLRKNSTRDIAQVILEQVS